uniref:Odorant receptor n=1 Tax=Glossina pallidipes TaxID=7398 RepID=A0A1A9ZFG2_GLOPL
MVAKFHDLNEITEQEDTPAERSRPLLNDIIAWHQNYNLFVEYIEELFSGVIFVHVTTSCASICSTLFCIVLKVWPFAPVLLLLNTSMYGYCGFGQLLVTANEDVTRMIYEVCIWYRLKVKEQKMILLMLRKSQSAAKLTVVSENMPLTVLSIVGHNRF